MKAAQGGIQKYRTGMGNITFLARGATKSPHIGLLVLTHVCTCLILVMRYIRTIAGPLNPGFRAEISQKMAKTVIFH